MNLNAGGNVNSSLERVWACVRQPQLVSFALVLLLFFLLLFANKQLLGCFQLTLCCNFD
jgi:hypothetical protein